YECGTKDARFGDQREHFGRCPAVEGRRLHGDQREVSGEQRRAQQCGDARRSVDNDVIGMPAELEGFAMQRVAREADDAEQAAMAPACALLGPVERRALRVGVDQRDPLSLPGPLAGEMQGERRLADATFLIEQRNDHRAPLPALHWVAPSPTTDSLDSSWLESKLGGSQATEFSAENVDPGS